MPRPDAASLCATILTPRLRIEPIAARHAAFLFEGLQDAAIYEWISMVRPTKIETLTARWANITERALASRADLDIGWAVQRLHDGAWIGKLDAFVEPNGIARNVGYLFLPTYWRCGYASEAVAAMCNHLAEHDIVEQRATVTVGNDASGRVLERAGFTRTRIIVGNDTIRGVAVDDIEYVRRDPVRIE